MRFIMFSVRDTKAGVFLQPFIARSTTDAIRNITSGFEQPEFLQSPVGRYPNEFDLFDIGEFDDECGISKEYTPVFVSNIADLRPRPRASTVSS